VVIQRANLTDSFIAEIERQIQTGELQGGARLPSESELSTRFGVGRSTVREAMKALSHKGIVEISVGRGSFVRPDAREQLSGARVLRVRLHDSRVQEVYEARKILEVELAGLASQRATPEDIAEIKAALAEMQRTLDDDKAFTAADVRFHVAVAHAAKNGPLEQFYSFAGDLVSEVIQDVIKLPSVKANSILLHTATCEAITRGDVAAARASVQNHMQYVQHVIEEEGYGGDTSFAMLPNMTKKAGRH
jgi:GntR family transcriptional regulator, transcriptional repressor for pyruvate dehydrogenase complex